MTIFNLKKAQFDTSPKRRFRASIYMDISVPLSDNLEEDRAKATEIAERIVLEVDAQTGNAYLGGIAFYNPKNITNPLDREI